MYARNDWGLRFQWKYSPKNTFWKCEFSWFQVIFYNFPCFYCKIKQSLTSFNKLVPFLFLSYEEFEWIGVYIFVFRRTLFVTPLITVSNATRTIQWFLADLGTTRYNDTYIVGLFDIHIPSIHAHDPFAIHHLVYSLYPSNVNFHFIITQYAPSSFQLANLPYPKNNKKWFYLTRIEIKSVHIFLLKFRLRCFRFCPTYF